MKIPLVGQSFALRSPAAAAQQTMNLIPQMMDDPNEGSKNKGILVGAPGYHLAGTVTGNIRGSWAGGGTVYVVGGNTLYEITQGSYVGGNPSVGSVTIANSWTLPNASDGKPVQMFGNGNQLLIVANGYAYIDNGSGPVNCQFTNSGYVNTNGTDVQFVSGDNFSTVPNGATIQIDGTPYSVWTVNSPTDLTLTASAGVQAGAFWQANTGANVTAVTGSYIDGYFGVQRPSGYPFSGTCAVAVSAGKTIVTQLTGSNFNSLSLGDGIEINGLGAYVVGISSPGTILVQPSVPVTSGTTFGYGEDTGRQFNISAPEDGEAWDPLDFASKEGYPDYIQSIFADREQLYLFGVESEEVWQDTGNALFPFQRIPGAAAREGSYCRYAPASVGGRLYYVGAAPHGQPVAYRLDGFTPVRVSNAAVEAAFALEQNMAACLAFDYAEDGHQFWVLNFSDTCWVYDATESAKAGYAMWHQRAKWTGSAFAGYEPAMHVYVPEWVGSASGAYASGMHLVCSLGSPNIYEMNLAYFDDNGSTQQWNRILPHLYDEGKRMFFGRMTLEMETGTATGGTQPTISRTYSDDRGHTFGNPVSPIMGGAGVNAAFSQRVVWPSNGSSYDRVLQFSGNNLGNARTCLIDLDLEIEAGTT
jgi:hypothetical protein